jgi:glycerophosphoryl diester phosphodiesterase
MNRRVVLAGGLLMAVLPSCASGVKAHTESRMLEIHGHRGSRGTHPENTLPAFEEALRAGVDVLEMDLGVTRDGVLVVYHDQKINPAICRAARGVDLLVVIDH